MPRPHNKEDLLKAAQDNYESLMNLINGLSEKELNTPFDFSDQPSKKEAHWSRDKNVRDILIHLYEWHQLLLDFPKNNKGVTDKKAAIAFLPADYSWKTYGAMNQMFWKRHQETSLEAAKAMFKKSHAAAMSSRLVKMQWRLSCRLRLYCSLGSPAKADAIRKGE